MSPILHGCLHGVPKGAGITQENNGEGSRQALLKALKPCLVCLVVLLSWLTTLRKLTKSQTLQERVQRRASGALHARGHCREYAEGSPAKVAQTEAAANDLLESDAPLELGYVLPCSSSGIQGV